MALPLQTPGRMKNPRSWLLLASLMGLSSLACSGAPKTGAAADDASGSVGLALQLPGGQTLNTFTYQITGPSAFAKSGSLDVSHSTALSAVISPLPAGTGFTITLTGMTADGSLTCSGTGMFGVMAHATSTVTVHVDCHAGAAT